MGLIREPLDVDFYVDPRPLTKKEERMISEFIREKKSLKEKSKSSSMLFAKRLPATARRKKILA